MKILLSIRGVRSVPAIFLLGLAALFSTTGDASGQNDTRSQVRELLKQAHAAMASGQVDSALAKLDEVLAVDADNPDAHLMVGQARLAEGDTLGAEEVLRRGAELAPLSSRLKLLLARVEIGKNRLNEAEALVDEVLALKPHESDALYVGGLLALARGDSIAALDIWEQSLKAELGEGKRQ